MHKAMRNSTSQMKHASFTFCTSVGLTRIPHETIKSTGYLSYSRIRKQRTGGLAPIKMEYWRYCQMAVIWYSHLDGAMMFLVRECPAIQNAGMPSVCSLQDTDLRTTLCHLEMLVYDNN
jgi:ribosomal protein L32